MDRVRLKREESIRPPVEVVLNGFDRRPLSSGKQVPALRRLQLQKPANDHRLLATGYCRSTLAVTAHMAFAAALDIEERGLAQSGQRSPIGSASCSPATASRFSGSSPQVVGQHLGHAVRQAAHAVDAKAQRTPAADTGHFVDDPAQPFRRRQHRRHAQHQADQTPDRFADRGDVAAGLADIQEDLERLMPLVAVDRDVGAAQRRLFAIALALQQIGTRPLGEDGRIIIPRERSVLCLCRRLRSVA